jgi:hypothetical protein
MVMDTVPRSQFSSILFALFVWPFDVSLQGWFGDIVKRAAFIFCAQFTTFNDCATKQRNRSFERFTVTT